MTPAHTEGPWRWELSEKSRSLHLVGGKPQFDLTVLDFARWGTHGATMRLRDTAHDGMNIMHRLHERRDWIAPIPGREHHASWCAAVTHPDARLIEQAPMLLNALRKLIHHAELANEAMLQEAGVGVCDLRAIAEARAAFVAATGVPP